ncbi:MAG TPA: GGDEF domain-containing protein [Gemmatimonadaceae bacterium]
MSPDLHSKEHANAEVLLWQARMRVLVAAAVGGAALLLGRVGVLHGNAALLILTVLVYTAIIGGITVQVHRTGSAATWVVALTVAADLCFIFVSIVASSPPERYERILILSFFALHLTQSCFGRRYAVSALIGVIVGYMVLIATTTVRGTGATWPEEVWSLALFTTAATLFIVQYGGFQQRLQRIVALFEQAEAGDFAESYDTTRDPTPDAITRVGHAYNRVRIQLASMVLTDPLTGCLNRRGFDQSLAREIARSARAGSDLSLLAIDIDHFKEVNDNYGHLAGDAVLREFGGLLVQTARGGDMVARTGGEEFSILLPDTDPGGAFKASTRLCEIVRAHNFLVNGKRLQLTISVGVVSSAASGSDAAGANLKERADEALYAAKRGGRDRVRVWNGTLSVIT